MVTMATYFMTGASGYIGGAVAAALVERGDRVRGLVRTRDTATRLDARGIEPVLGTLDDAALLEREARASDGVINAANADNATAAKALIAGLVGSAKPFLHTSGSSVVADDARGNVRSEIVFSDEAELIVHPLKQARHEINQDILRAADSGVRAVVICPSLIYGRGRGLNPNSIQIPFLIAEGRKRGAIPLVGRGLNIWSNVHIDDVVALYLLALRGAPAGAFYFAENGETAYIDLSRALAKRLAILDTVSVPADEAAKVWGAGMAYFSLGGNSRVRARRARRELVWAPIHASVLDWIANEMPV